MSNRLNQQREEYLQPKRMETAKLAIVNKNLIIVFEDNTRIEFMYKDNIVKFYPYSGWHTGKGIKDGRGLDNLLKQLI